MAPGLSIAKFGIILFRMWGFSSGIVCSSFIYESKDHTGGKDLERDYLIIDNCNKINIIWQVRTVLQISRSCNIPFKEWTILLMTLRSNDVILNQ